MIAEDIASKSSDVFNYIRWHEKTQFSGFMFTQVVQKH